MPVVSPLDKAKEMASEYEHPPARPPGSTGDNSTTVSLNLCANVVQHGRLSSGAASSPLAALWVQGLMQQAVDAVSKGVNVLKTTLGTTVRALPMEINYMS